MSSINRSMTGISSKIDPDSIVKSGMEIIGAGDVDVPRGETNPVSIGLTHSMSREIMPCPFCGRVDMVFTVMNLLYNWRCKCVYCGAEGPVGSNTPDEAYRKWNERR